MIGVLVSGKSAAGPEQTAEREAGRGGAECPTGTVVSFPRTHTHDSQVSRDTRS